MKHEMKLNSRPFNTIKTGLKRIEMRLCDGKRRLIQIGDEIEFCNRDTQEKILTRVCSLTKFPNFEELYMHFDKEELGYLQSENADPDDMSRYYSKEEIERYGVLAIEISLC